MQRRRNQLGGSSLVEISIRAAWLGAFAALVGGYGFGSFGCSSGGHAGGAPGDGGSVTTTNTGGGITTTTGGGTATTTGGGTATTTGGGTATTTGGGATTNTGGGITTTTGGGITTNTGGATTTSTGGTGSSCSVTIVSCNGVSQSGATAQLDCGLNKRFSGPLGGQQLCVQADACNASGCVTAASSCLPGCSGASTTSGTTTTGVSTTTTTGVSGSTATGAATGGRSTGAASTGTATTGAATTGRTTGAATTGGTGTTTGAGTLGAIGAACSANGDCASGLTCILATGNTVFGVGGPSHGYCSFSCKTQADLTKCVSMGGGDCLDFSSSTATVADFYCVGACTHGSGGATKCGGRSDVACYTIPAQPDAGFAGEDVCVPTCSQDKDCPAGRKCDPAGAICVNSPSTGDPLGTHCDPNASTITCAGFCVPLGSGSTLLSSYCTMPCVLGVVNACNSAALGASLATGGPHGLCLIGDQSNSGSGDYGYCVPECDQAADCPDKVDPGATCDTSVQAAAGHGACSWGVVPSVGAPEGFDPSAVGAGNNPMAAAARAWTAARTPLRTGASRPSDKVGPTVGRYRPFE